MIPIPSVLVRNAAAAWGDAGRAFVAALPDQVAAIVRDWGLQLGQPYPMTFHWVCRVRTADGTAAVLKLGPPGSRDLARQVTALRHFDGHASVRVLADDASRGAVLLERASPATVASALVPHGDIFATAAIITVMRGLHRPAPPGLDLPDLLTRDRTSFVEHLRRYPGDQPMPRRLVVRALGLLVELCSDVASPVVLHNDLHHDNVLRASDLSEREPWLAIDPHGVVGDPVADVGAMLFNPEIERRDPALLALVPARLDQLADGLGVPRERVVAWGFVGAVLSQVWTAEEAGAPATRALDVAIALEPMLH